MLAALPERMTDQPSGHGTGGLTLLRHGQGPALLAQVTAQPGQIHRGWAGGRHRGADGFQGRNRPAVNRKKEPPECRCGSEPLNPEVQGGHAAGLQAFHFRGPTDGTRVDMLKKPAERNLLYAYRLRG